MKRHLITVGFLILAIISYVAGFAPGARIFIALGIILECIFWFRLVGHNRNATASTASNGTDPGA